MLQVLGCAVLSSEHRTTQGKENAERHERAQSILLDQRAPVVLGLLRHRRKSWNRAFRFLSSARTPERLRKPSNSSRRTCSCAPCGTFFNQASIAGKRRQPSSDAAMFTSFHFGCR